MGHAREFGVVAMFGVMLLVALPPSFVKGTAEVCHAVHDTPTGPFSCMDCDSCKNCMEGGSCDVHCSTCGPCYADPNATDCDLTTCEIDKCMGCALCVNCDPGCYSNCSVCQYYLQMLECQNGPCSGCDPCYDNLDAPGCAPCADCVQCQNCNTQPNCHDCRCCKDVGCAVCEGEDVDCPAEGYTAEELSHTFIPPPPLAPGELDIKSDSSNTAEVAAIVIGFAVVVLLVVNFTSISKADAGSAEDKQKLLSSESDGVTLPNYNSTGTDNTRVPSGAAQQINTNL